MKQETGDLWQTSLAVYSLVVFVAMIRISVHTRAFSLALAAAYAFSLGVFFAFEATYDKIGALSLRGAAPKLYFVNPPLPHSFLDASSCCKIFLLFVFFPLLLLPSFSSTPPPPHTNFHFF